MSCAPGRAKRRLLSALAVVGVGVAVTLAVRLETASLGDVNEVPPSEWTVVPDLFGAGFWLIDEQGEQLWIDHDGWVTVGDSGVMLMISWPWRQWLPMPEGKISAAAGVG